MLKKNLLPSIESEFVEADRWMEWQATDNSKSLVPVFWGLIRTAPGDQDKNAIRAATTELNKSFRLLNLPFSPLTLATMVKLVIPDSKKE